MVCFKEKISFVALIDDFKKRHIGANINFGSSLVMLFKDGILFTLAKEKNWRFDSLGHLTIDFAGIGGAIENHETPFECLSRELKEETSLDLNDLDWPKNAGAVYINNNGESTERIGCPLLSDEKILPFAVLELKVENKHKKVDDDRESYLLLFLYLGKLKAHDDLKLIPERDLPGYFYVHNSRLNESFSGVVLKPGELVDGFDLYLRNGFEKKIEGSVLFVPKFTPLAVKDSGYDYLDFLLMFNV
jgi:8-oxo-dGTP pyrophosphatase MutT (NUDIX family)